MVVRASMRATDSLADAHADYYAALGERAASTPAALAPEIPNLRAALERLAISDTDRFLAVVNATWRVWSELGLLRDGQRNASLVLRLGDAAPDEVRVLLLRNASWAAFFVSAFDDALPLAEERLNLARRIDDPHGLIGAINSLAQMRLGRSDVSGARALANEALQLARRLVDPQLLTGVLGALCVIDQAAADYSACVRHAREAVEVARGTGDFHLELNALHNLGQALLMNGEIDEAEACLRDALNGIDDPTTVSWAVMSLGVIAAKRGNVLLGARLNGAEEANTHASDSFRGQTKPSSTNATQPTSARGAPTRPSTPPGAKEPKCHSKKPVPRPSRTLPDKAGSEAPQGSVRNAGPGEVPLCRSFLCRGEGR